MSFKKQVVQSLVWRGMYFVTILIMNILLSRYFEAGNAGWIFYICNNFSLLVILVGLTMETSINYYGAKKEIDTSQLVWFSFLWTFIVALIVFVGLWFYFGRYKDTTIITRSQYLFYAICYIAGIQLTNIFTVLFYARKNFFLPNFLMVLLNVVLIIIIPKQQGINHTNATLFIYIYFSYFIITGLVLAISFMVKHKSWQRISLPAMPEIKLLLRYAVVALAANVIFFLVYRVDYWFVKKYCTEAELGNYIQVSKLAQMMLIIPSIISSVVFPHIASGVERVAVKDSILRIGRLISILYLFIFIIVLIFGQWFFPEVFGYTYTLMFVPFLFLLPGVWALSNLSILSAYFGGVNKVRVNVQGAAIALIFILAGDIVFIPLYGIKAAAIVSSVGYLVNFLYSFVNMRKEHAVSLKEYWYVNKDDIQWLRSILQP